MEQQTKNCQNCKNDFAIEPEDFLFYEKIKVPPPTFCPECRRQRRLAFRNTHALYKRKDSFSGKDLISIYSPDKELVVIDQKEWWKDSWDSMDYGLVYDFSKPFFSQWQELRNTVPLQSLSNSKAVNSDYCNVAEENYDCYLVTACFRNERVMYSDSVYYNKDSSDLHVVHHSEYCFDDVNCSHSYKLFYSLDSSTCTNSYFLFDCKNCTDCFMSSNLRNKSFCIRNKQYSREEYLKLIEEEKLSSFKNIQRLKKEFEDLKKTSIHKYASITGSIKCTGNNIDKGKNCYACFDVADGTEDSKYIFWGGEKIRDSYDTDACAIGERFYEIFDVGVGGEGCRFGSVIYSCARVEYSFNCYNSTDCFGCIGLRSKQYCILNKQYSKEEYEELLPKIKSHMNELPYIDSLNRIYKYGEFFPIELSPFCYNETVANDFFPLKKEEVLEHGFTWKEKEVKNYNPDVSSEDLEDDIQNQSDTILNSVISCAHAGMCDCRCSTAFKILENEFSFYKRFNIPLPRLCYGCRHQARFKTRNPLKLWHRQCMCDKSNHTHQGKCEVDFETSYAPERPETVYCEKCYQQEIY